MNPYYSSCFINVLFANGMILSKLHKRANKAVRRVAEFHMRLTF